jgi:hypothetical protein
MKNKIIPQKLFKLYWIYRKDGWFLGGGVCTDMKDGERELKWRKNKDPDAYIEWEPGLFGYEESYQIARKKAEHIQATQPGYREQYNARKRERKVTKQAKRIGAQNEIISVAFARIKDGMERLGLPTVKPTDELPDKMKIEQGENEKT